MNYILKILRRKSAEYTPRFQAFEYKTELKAATVATALMELNERTPLVDTEGNAADKIRWDCGCLQKKCGACAMVINGRPALACNTRLADMKKNAVTVEPLRKFPVVADLIVDRSILFDNLKTMKVWAESDIYAKEKKQELLYEASRCMQCGCCLEVCPNFYPGGEFAGMSAMTLSTRLLTELPHRERQRLRKAYIRHVYNGCGKSLACRNICPAGIDIERLLVNSNAVAMWKMI